MKSAFLVLLTICSSFALARGGGGGGNRIPEVACTAQELAGMRSDLNVLARSRQDARQAAGELAAGGITSCIRRGGFRYYEIQNSKVFLTFDYSSGTLNFSRAGL